jgi:hypothetical protein
VDIWPRQQRRKALRVRDHLPREQDTYQRSQTTSCPVQRQRIFLVPKREKPTKPLITKCFAWNKNNVPYRALSKIPKASCVDQIYTDIERDRRAWRPWAVAYARCERLCMRNRSCGNFFHGAIDFVIYWVINLSNVLVTETLREKAVSVANRSFPPPLKNVVVKLTTDPYLDGSDQPGADGQFLTKKRRRDADAPATPFNPSSCCG